MCNNVYKTSTYVKNTVIKVLAREVKLKYSWLYFKSIMEVHELFTWLQMRN